jgi:hypothetical protein
MGSVLWRVDRSTRLKVRTLDIEFDVKIQSLGCAGIDEGGVRPVAWRVSLSCRRGAG